MGGAALTGLMAVYAIRAIHSQSKIKQDAAIGIVLSVFFGFGIVLLTMITNGSYSQSSGLDEFIFGQAASLVGADVQILIGSAVVLLFLSFLFFKELKLLIFDPLFAGGIGLPIRFSKRAAEFDGCAGCHYRHPDRRGYSNGRFINYTCYYGPVLDGPSGSDGCSLGLIGGLSGAFGALLSSTISGLPTGPVIVVAATTFFLISFLFAPQRGILFRMVENKKHNQIVLNNFLLDTMYEQLEKRYTAGQYSALFSREELEEQTHLPKDGLEKNDPGSSKTGTAHPYRPTVSINRNRTRMAYDSSLLRRIQDIHITHEAELGSWSESAENGRSREPRDYLLNERIHTLLAAEKKIPVSLKIKQTSIEYADHI